MARLGRFKDFREKYHLALGVAFFVLGFLFDLLLLEHIDSRLMLIHQGTYVVLLTVLMGLDHRLDVRGTAPAGFWGNLLEFREWLIHFFLGTLLNASLIFYFRAAPGAPGWEMVFLAAIVVLLVVNELPRFRSLGPVVRVALLSFVTTSYLTYLLPVLAGFLSAWLFLAAVGAGAALTIGVWKVYAWITRDPHWTFRRAALPGLLCQAMMVVLYFARVVPPVPLSVKWIGVYHEARPEGPKHRLSYLPQSWRLWRHRDVVYRARPGDRVTMFARIFAPRHFHDQLDVRWAYRDPRGGTWTYTDAIPLTITGGLEAGWRAVAYKEHYEPGEWKVQIETADHRTVGQVRFTIVEDQGTDPRVFAEEVR